MLINVPIESLEERYSADWNKWVPEEFKALNVSYADVYPEPWRDTIKHGQFLDVIGTHIFKARQLEMMLEWVDSEDITSNDVLFFHDLWWPGLEALFYVRQALNLNFKIAGMLHAGTYDPHDFLTQSGMGRWARGIETSWFSEVDMIFVATEFHKRLLVDSGRASENKIRVTGFPIRRSPDSKIPDIVENKTNLVVFPHRIAVEKSPHEFAEIAEYATYELSEAWNFVRTKDVTKTKNEYYQLLSKAKVAVSCAQQETWGIAQQESVLHHCLPVVPNRLSYVEMYPECCRYDSITEAVDKCVEFSRNYESYITKFWFLSIVDRIEQNGRMAIPRMVNIMRLKGWNV